MPGTEKTETSTRVAVCARSGDGLSAPMDPRFGRAPYFAIVDSQTGELVEAIANEAAQEAHGAGTASARLMRDKGVTVVVAGRFGPKAAQALDALGVEMRVCDDGLSVEQALQELQGGRLAQQGAF